MVDNDMVLLTTGDVTRWRARLAELEAAIAPLAAEATTLERRLRAAQRFIDAKETVNVD